jgi:DNA modification methylase
MTSYDYQTTSGPEISIRAVSGSHLICRADSARTCFKGPFDLILCSPPYFHPAKNSRRHGAYLNTRDIDIFARWTAEILVRAKQGVKKHGAICFLKTDVKYKRSLLPLGFRIADECETLGARIQAHWVWERHPYFSPYAPSVSNIFVLGECDLSFLRHPGIFRSRDSCSREFPSSFTPDLFEQLIRQLTLPGACVADPFAGLGSTAIGASRSQRWSVGLEISRGQVAKAKQILKTHGVARVRLLNFGRGSE